MNTKQLVLWGGAALLGMSSLSAQAVPSLYGYSFNVDGTVTDVKLSPFDPIVAAPAGVNVGGFNDSTGLGSITATITGAGSHTFDAFFDHEIDVAINSFFNESAAASGVAAAGQSWEIDEPGFIDGDIYENFQASALDNGIGTSIYGDTFFPDDVSMAMGWDFTLAAGETGFISLMLSDFMPASGFFLTQSDLNSNDNIYLASSLSIKSTTAVPAPPIVWLLGSGIGIIGLIGTARRKKS